jgi:hypothetical protein
MEGSLFVHHVSDVVLSQVTVVTIRRETMETQIVFMEVGFLLRTGNASLRTFEHHM